MNKTGNQPPEEYIDISSGKPVAAGQHFGGSAPSAPNQGGAGSKKPIIIIASVAAALVVIVGVAGFVLLNRPAPEEEKPTEPPIFTFTDKTIVSGVDITGKTMEQAKLVLEKNTDSFIPSITFDIDINGKQEQLKESDFSYTFNIDEVLAQAKADNEGEERPTGENPCRTYTVKATVKPESIDNNVSKLCEEHDSEPKNAYVSKFHPYEEERFEFTEAVSGVKVNGNDLKKKLSEGFQRGNSLSSVTAEVTITEADTNAEELSNKLVKLSTYETYSTNTYNGTENMRISLEACNGSVIEPDGVWSFNECTGDSNLESNGYKPAGVILEGKLTEGIGGGICQSSSTIYNAAIRANMGIEERYNHKWASSYVPTGLDATIDYPNLDLKLSNPTDYQMFLECRVEGSTLYASVWGVKPDSWDEIHTHNEMGETGSKTYTVRAWRVYFKDGEEVDREELDKSTYDNDHGVYFYEADNDSQERYGDDDSSASDSGSSNGSSSNDGEQSSEEDNGSAHSSSGSSEQEPAQVPDDE